MPLFGEKLKTLREQSHLTQGQLAELMGVSKATISAYELGQNKPPIQRIYQLASILHTDLYYLLGSDERRVIDVTSLTPAQETSLRLMLDALLDQKGTDEK